LEIHALSGLYHYAWFVGFGVSFVTYLILMPRPRAGS
jgi:cytosine/uracil/thiamine/allantoin permease